MPTRNVVITDHQAKLEALRSAIQVGVDDIEAGRFYTFETREALRAHLRKLGKDAIEGKPFRTAVRRTAAE